MTGPAPDAAARAPDAAVRAALEDVRARLGMVPDAWRPPVQGAVGHLTGLAAPDGSRWVLKVFPAPAASRALVEDAALRLAAGLPGVPVPAVAARGTAPAGPGGPAGAYLVIGRLPGERWSDVRPRCTVAETAGILRAAAGVLRALHRRTGARFGPVVPDDDAGDAAADGPGPDAVERVHRRWVALEPEFRSSGGPPELADGVGRLLRTRRDALAGCRRPVLCHHDVNGGNLLLAPDRAPSGLVDWEKAGWDDPLADLALTAVHVEHHEPALVPELVRAYGVTAGPELQRFDVHRALLLAAERCWITHDRPAGADASMRGLDRRLRDLLVQAGLLRAGVAGRHGDADR
ncbi:phosphotransferase family protein [Nakamurella endophytica]|uniref:Aminoglycoside phosphotransferase domain-containing protein n=1 Tax=Nakamurella endophytica TaxID=1748367 RepID=A0A917T3Y4_9ACTN|nr:aminoglycoside phosphotransferase family protein [Nakamurella endophytica]GGM08483.1 hypothetical protein GCM10011594_30520 [Nakamurella endophytica]